MRLEKRYALFVGFFSQFSYLFALQTIPPLLPTLIKEFDLGFTTASSLMWLVALPGVFLALLGGLLSEKYGVKRMSIFGTGVMTASSALCILSTSIPFLQAYRLLLGIGGALVVVSAPGLILQWFDTRELGTAMGIFALTMPVATVAAFNSLGFVADAYGWRAAFVLTTIINILALALCIFSKEGSIVFKDHTGLSPLRNGNIWVLGGIWALFNMAVVGYSTWGKTIFIGYGLSGWMPDLLASMLMVGTLTTPFTGFLSDRFGGRRRFIILASAAMFLMFPLFPYIEVTFLVELGLALGLLLAFLPPTLFALPEEILGAGKGVLGWGVLSAFMNLGFILGPLSLGYVLDTAKSSAMVFFLLSFFSLLSLLLALVLKSS